MIAASRESCGRRAPRSGVPSSAGVACSADPVRLWHTADRGYLFCRKGEVREIMRPIPIPGDVVRWGLCDGIHRDDHELVPA